MTMILKDYLKTGLAVVLCGTAAGDRSAARGHFYAGPGNKFWPMLYTIGLTATLLRPEDDAMVGGHGIGLTDLVKHHSGNDAYILRGREWVQVGTTTTHPDGGSLPRLGYIKELNRLC
jgi:mismatch-specific thymine-DNA glycosylase